MPALPPAEQFVAGLLLKLGDRFAAIAGRLSESSAIRDGLLVYIDPIKTDTVWVEAPQYWALYLHDGRGPVVPHPGITFLIWYKDPAEDPRNPSGVVRAFEVRRLTPEEFVRDRDAGKLVITRRAGPFEGRPFFDMAEKEFESIVDEMVAADFERYMLDGLRSYTSTARIRL